MSERSLNIDEALRSFSFASGFATVVFASILAFALMKRKGSATEDAIAEEDDELTFDKSEYPGGLISVYFGTQTGTAENFANQLETEGREHGFFVKPVDLEDVEVEDLVDEIRKDTDSNVARCLFLAATYGEGEATDNATSFAVELAEKAGENILFETQPEEEKSEPELVLDGLEFGVFGLGNKQYDHYNAMGKFFDHAVARVGGKRVLELGLGDDDDDIEADFEKWRMNVLWPALERLYIPKDVNLTEVKKRNSVHVKPPVTPFAVEYLGKRHIKPASVSESAIHGSCRAYFKAEDCPIQTVRELRTEKDPGSTVHVEIDISKSKVKYETADNLNVFPVNHPDAVESVSKTLKIELDEYISVHGTNGAVPFPNPISIRECLTRYMDLARGMRRSDMGRLAFYAQDAADKQFLTRVSTNQGIDEFKDKISDDFINMADILSRCPSISIPFEHFLALCPHMQARLYTICSSVTVSPKSVHLTVVVDRENKKKGGVFEGLCSSFLSNQKQGALVRVLNEASTFRLPTDPTTPIIMIGPGTGIAPMRAMLQERAHMKTQGKAVGPNILYFGCKDRTQDYLYQDELEAFQSDNVLDELHLAFSRETSQKVYVQHLLEKNASQTWMLISNGAHIYVCGAVRMGHDVTEALKRIAASEGGLSSYDAKAFVENLAQKEKRYISELY